MIVLNETEKYIEKSIFLDQNNINYLNELGSHKFRLEKISEAFECYSNVLKLDEHNVIAILGKLKCQIVKEKTSDLNKQFEFLSVIAPYIHSNPV
jgi:hypothetical protein